MIDRQRIQEILAYAPRFPSDDKVQLAQEIVMLREAIKEALIHFTSDGRPSFASEAYAVRILETALNEGRVLRDGE